MPGHLRSGGVQGPQQAVSGDSAGSRGKTEYFTQLGTGNYNEKTARLYTDLSLITANPEIGLEAAEVFQALAKGETVESSHHLLVAPRCLQNRVLR